MKKHLILFGIIIIILIVSFSRYTEKKISGDTDKIELLEYSIETKKYDNGYNTIGKGFIYSDEAELFLITGIVKNISDEILISVNITVKFYDNASELLTEKTTYLGSIAINNTRDFGIYYFSYEDYFEYVNDIKFVFEVT